MKKGFTLAELAVVLLIVGLLVVGISSGSKLIEQARIRNIIVDASEHILAFSTFKLTYNSALPGDMDDAHDFWGADCDATAANCNGDGDGIIEFAGASDADREVLRAWQHLFLAEIISDSVSGSGASYTTANSPNSSLSGAFFFTESNDTTGSFEVLDGQDYIFFGGADGATDYQGVLTVLDARSIDNKLDDGVANSGSVFGITSEGGTATNCSALSTTANGADYNLASTAKDCYLSFVLN